MHPSPGPHPSYGQAGDTWCLGKLPAQQNHVQARAGTGRRQGRGALGWPASPLRLSPKLLMLLPGMDTVLQPEGELVPGLQPAGQLAQGPQKSKLKPVAKRKVLISSNIPCGVALRVAVTQYSFPGGGGALVLTCGPTEAPRKEDWTMGKGRHPSCPAGPLLGATPQQLSYLGCRPSLPSW